MTNHTKLPMSSNKDICENNQVAEEWRNLNGEKKRLYLLNNRSLFVARQLKVSPIGSKINEEASAKDRGENEN